MDYHILLIEISYPTLPQQSDSFSNKTLHPNYEEQDMISLTDIMVTLAKNVKAIIISPTILCSLMIIYVSFLLRLSTHQHQK